MDLHIFAVCHTFQHRKKDEYEGLCDNTELSSYNPGN